MVSGGSAGDFHRSRRRNNPQRIAASSAAITRYPPPPSFDRSALRRCLRAFGAVIGRMTRIVWWPPRHHHIVCRQRWSRPFAVPASTLIVHDTVFIEDTLIRLIFVFHGRVTDGDQAMDDGGGLPDGWSHNNDDVYENVHTTEQIASRPSHRVFHGKKQQKTHKRTTRQATQ